MIAIEASADDPFPPPIPAAELLAQVACIWEATARKCGNVHRYADFASTTHTDFLLSAAALGAELPNARRFGVGAAVHLVVRQVKLVSRTNTNLGIVLLLVPLDMAYGTDGTYHGVETVLARTTVDDTRALYAAIRLANPGGLGDAAEQDVRAEPTATLLEAMRLAADRDLIARQYATGFADVFGFGVPALLAAFERFGCVEAAIIDTQLRWLAEYPDSLIARKNGPDVAADVQMRAREVLRLGGLDTSDGRRAGVAFDRLLRSDGNRLNPGTTADLITACLFVALRENKVAPTAPFRWPAPDWL